jgi:hypothetical protein
MRMSPFSPSARRRHTVVLLPVLCACATWGCLGLRARPATIPEVLDMPEPPPRVVDVREPEAAPPPISLPEEPVRNTPPRPRPAPTAEQPRPPQATPPEAPADVSKPEELTPRPPTTLQTTPTQREEEVQRRIQGVLGQAAADLNRINYQALTADGRQQYDQAKRFVSQAEEALRSKNLVFANTMAEKAATLATQLSGR